ncbi:MAG: DUF4430 domain-containing protein [Eubacterium sp.]|nr:DUF4430 domain-containing protein [Eubacterium sp.]
MNRKIIIIITVLICLCAALITAQYFANTETENTTALTTLSDAPQTDAPTDRPSANTDEAQTAAPSEAQTESAAKESTTKPQSTKANHVENTGKAQSTTKPQSPDKESSTQTTTKPQSTTTVATTKSQSTTAPETKKQTVTVTFSINCEKALAFDADVPASGYFIAPCKYTGEPGDTVFDILEAVAKENGITLTYQSKSYIQAINGLAERDCGAGSGWTYKVNGVKPNKSAAKYEIADGDIIEWYYVTSSAD